MNTNTMCPSLSKSYYCLLNNKGKKQTIETSKSGMTIAVMLKISLIRTNTVHRLVVCLAWSRLTLVINITFYQTAENVFLKKKNKGNNSANWANSLDIHCMSHSLFTLYLFLIKKSCSYVTNIYNNKCCIYCNLHIYFNTKHKGYLLDYLNKMLSRFVMFV